MIMMPRRKQKHRRMVVVVLVVLAVAGITLRRHTGQCVEVPS